MSAELEFLQGETPGRKVALTGAELTIGRDSTANLILSHPNVSRQHAKIIYQGDTWYISDLGSTNGTIVNGRRISASPLQLRHGDLIEIGPYVLRFQDFGVSFQATQAWTNQPLTSMPQNPPLVSKPTQQTVQPPQIDMSYRISPYAILILALGILSLCFWIAGPAAWILGNNALRDINAGFLNPNDRIMVNAGRILGIISTTLTVLLILIYLISLICFALIPIFSLPLFRLSKLTLGSWFSSL